MLIQAKVTVYINDCEVEAEAEFDCTYEPPERDVGWFGGWNVELICLHLGNLKLNRYQVKDMIGAAELDALEDRGADAAMDEAA